MLDAKPLHETAQINLYKRVNIIIHLLYNVKRKYGISFNMTHLSTIRATLMMNMSIEPWYAINDNVMGGLSWGGIALSDEGLHFNGALSLQNNGGFSSVRRPASDDLTDSRGIRLTIKGEVLTGLAPHQINQSFDGIAWRREFATDGSVQVIDLAYPEFEAVHRGRRIKNAGAIDPAHITQLGFLIADKKKVGFHCPF